MPSPECDLGNIDGSSDRYGTKGNGGFPAFISLDVYGPQFEMIGPAVDPRRST